MSKNEEVKGLNNDFLVEIGAGEFVNFGGGFGFGKACGRRRKLETTRVNFEMNLGKLS